MKMLRNKFRLVVVTLVLATTVAWIDPGVHEGYSPPSPASALSFEEEMRRLKEVHRQENVEAVARFRLGDQALVQEREMHDLRRESTQLALGATEVHTSEAAVRTDTNCNEL